MGKSSLRTILIYSTLITIFVIVLAFLTTQVTKSYMVNTIEDRLKAEGNYIEAVLEASKLTGNEYYQQIEDMSNRLSLGFIYGEKEKGVVLNTISHVLRISDDHIPQDIHEDLVIHELNKSDALYYYAIEIKRDNESSILILTLPSHSISVMMKNLWFIYGLALCLVIVGIFIAGFNIFEKYVKPIRSASNVAEKLAEGNYNARTYETYFGEAAQLTYSINTLARNLQEMSLQSEVQNDRLQAVVDNMDSGLMLINEKGYIQLVNRAFLDNFEEGLTSDYIGYLYYEAIPFEDIHDVVKDVFMLEDNVQKTLILSIGIERKFFAVSGAPIFNHHKDWKGVVLVFHDITDMKHLEEMRKDFVANVSHELKTPITSIKGFAETLLDGAKEDAVVLDKFLHIIHKESVRMQYLIHDLLELSKLENNNFQLNLEKVSIKKLVDDVLSLVAHIAEEKNITIRADVNERIVLEGDGSRLTQLLLNLVSNAVHYTPNSGEVFVGANDLGEDIKLFVKDTGIGIPKEEIPRIFERFYRVDKARSRESGGTGLGLAIVKHIVEAHHGKINVESELHKGTTFSIDLHKKFTNP
ncbi:two-component system phosphate regulon sensor histidine kinase PhoR [Salirhabdus euzebyi]|uniref:histidine kinase n=1 Tax=Salirhabdus euzebyi TaxID=394506 RepID=A0A841PTC7_9BACI|nr:HAMP domain-containing sensor histidine kinase [Salirhabdus euzebyi]MBB6452079.1 two-component system phosphate regulon sensor histidine kinase PhoR [Salirhabdus euzebyi]